MNSGSFNKMKKTPIIINSSRGSIINENDLLKAYKEKLIGGFALDVYNTEPVRAEFYKEITSSMNCILTPHTSGVTVESNIRVSQFIAEKVVKFLSD